MDGLHASVRYHRRRHVFPPAISHSVAVAAEMTPAVTVVGSFVVGMTLRAGRMPVFGETLVGTDFDMGPGGKGSNQAVAAARLGARVAFAGVVGDDDLGTMAAELYANEGIDASLLRRSQDAATGAGFVILNDAGENGIVIDLGANGHLDPADVDRAEDRIATSDVVMSVLEIQSRLRLVPWSWVAATG